MKLNIPSLYSRVVCVLVMQAEGRKFSHTREKSFLTVSVLRDEKGPSQPFILWGVDKMSTVSQGENSGVAMTTNKGADDKAEPQRV